MNDEMLHSVTNYECYKGLYSSFNSMNMFEINHSLLRQFGPENWTLYKGKHLLSFVDNHDVTRVASILNNIRHLPLIYALAFGTKEGKYDEAAELIKQGDEAFSLGHNAHADLLTMDANGEISNGYMLLMHAEDQLMSAESFRTLADEFIALYKRIDEK